MKKINLRELYPDVYTTDFFVDVTEEVYKIEYYTIANQKQARYNIDKNKGYRNGAKNRFWLFPQGAD